MNEVYEELRGEALISTPVILFLDGSSRCHVKVMNDLLNG